MGEVPILSPQVAARYQVIRSRILAAGERVGRRDSDAVQVVAVTKGFGPEAVVAAALAGIRTIGENRVQEARAKRPLVVAELEAQGIHPVAWHLIGHLQTNKVRLALELFDWIAAVDSLPLAAALSERLLAAGRTLPALVEIKTAPEATKHGILPAEALDQVPRIAALPGLDVRGLMTVAPLGAPPRPAFGALARIRDALSGRGLALPHLSMGMSGDYEIAVEEGATMVRLGSALFGPRGGEPASA
jgi:PLP dependent protein